MFRTKTAIIACAAILALPTALALAAERTIVRETTIVEPAPATTTTTTTYMSPGTTTTIVEPMPVTHETTTTTVTTQTATEARLPVGTPIVLRMEEFDLNHDDLLMMDEIGAVLFRIYDTDGNMVIDNMEYERPAVLTVTPMQTTTKVSYDFDGDGMADKEVYTYETFMKHSQLTRFDHNGNGLSPHEFAGMSFIEADIDNDHAIVQKEWQGLYIASIDKKNRQDAALNK